MTLPFRSDDASARHTATTLRLVVSTPESAPPAQPHPADAPRMLIVDDETALRDLFARYFRYRGFEVQTAPDAESAWHLLRASRFAVLVSDVRLPGSSGIALASRAREADPLLAVVLCSGADIDPDALRALGGSGATLVPKPVPLHALHESVGDALRVRDAAMRPAPPVRPGRGPCRIAEGDHGVGVIEALVNAMEMKDVYLRGHSHRVAALAVAIGAEMGWNEARLTTLEVAGRLHDVGKIGVREAILHKQGELTVAEFAHVREHVAIGMEILAPLEELGEALDFIEHHHERLDGSGYPHGLTADAISDGGRILAVADAYDAMVSFRPHRQPETSERALECLRSLARSSFEPAVVEALAAVLDRRAQRFARGAGLRRPFESLHSLPSAQEA